MAPKAHHFSIEQGTARSARCEFAPTGGSLFPLEVIGLLANYDHLIGPFPEHRKLAAIGIKTGIAARIIGNNVVNEIVIFPRSELVRCAWAEKRMSRPVRLQLVRPCPEFCRGPKPPDKTRTRPSANDTGNTSSLLEFAPEPGRTDAVSLGRATPARAPARPKCFLQIYESSPSAISAPVLQHLSGSLCAYGNSYPRLRRHARKNQRHPASSERNFISGREI